MAKEALFSILNLLQIPARCRASIWECRSHPSRLFVTYCLGIGLLLPILLAFTATSALGQDETTKGKWGPLLKDRPNAPIHTHVLPTGKVLFWGRRDKGPGLDPHETTPYLWDPDKSDMTGFTKLEQPTNKKGDKFNLFCSGHTFMADGRLLVAGRHFADGQGVRYAAIFNYMDSS
jgi:galactose oxidase